MLKILLSLFLFFNIILAKNNTDTSFEGVLKLLKQKEALKTENKSLERRIISLEEANKANELKYNVLLDSYNKVTKTTKETKIEKIHLINEEKKSRLPIPFAIIETINNNYAKAYKLNWYYSFNDKNKPVYNGYYEKTNIFVGDIFLGYKVTKIKDNYIEYCNIKKPEICLRKIIINNDLAKKLDNTVIKNGIPNQMLIDKEKNVDMVTMVLKSTNPLIRKIKKEKIENLEDELKRTKLQLKLQQNLKSLQTLQNNNNKYTKFK